jgi:MFS family permease
MLSSTEITAEPHRIQSAFHHRAFLLFWLARGAAGIAMQMQVVAVGWQIYDMTGDAFALGLVGLCQFLPTLALALVETAAVGMLCVLSAAGILAPGLIFATVFVIGTAKSFEGPASQALLSALVPPDTLPNAVAWNSSAIQVAMVGGPALGGLLYIAGPEAVYAVGTVLLAAGAVFISLVRPRPVVLMRRAMNWSSLLAGIGFIRSRPEILGAISLDLVAVLLGGATALLPVYARDVLHVGPWGLGLLRSAPAIGALLTAVALAHLGLKRRAGRALLVSVAGFGVATVVFGLSADPLLSFAALMVLGAADQISVFVRQTLIQLATPDDMRGRVGAVSSLFIGASNQLGEFESGTAAALLGAVPAVVLGGVGAVAAALFWGWRFPDLRRIDRLSTVTSGER